MEYPVTERWMTIETTMELDVTGFPVVTIMGPEGGVSRQFEPTEMRVDWTKESLGAPWKVDNVSLLGRQTGSSGRRASIALLGESMRPELGHGRAVDDWVVESVREIVRELEKGLSS